MDFHYDLVVALPNGRPCESRVIEKEFNKLKEKLNLPNVVFHSLRHSSTTYKLKLNQISCSKLMEHQNSSAASCGVFDPRGSRQISMQAWLLLGSLLRGNKVFFRAFFRSEQVCPVNEYFDLFMVILYKNTSTASRI